MYSDELKALKRKLEEKRAEMKGFTVLDTVDVPLNIQEVNYILNQLKFIKG